MRSALPWLVSIGVHAGVFLASGLGLQPVPAEATASAARGGEWSGAIDWARPAPAMRAGIPSPTPAGARRPCPPGAPVLTLPASVRTAAVRAGARPAERTAPDLAAEPTAVPAGSGQPGAAPTAAAVVDETRASASADAPAPPLIAASRAGTVVAPAPAPSSAPATYLDTPQPQYPEAARRAGLEGLVVLRAQITAEGLPTRLRVMRGSGVAMLDRAALAGVSRWRFVPAQNGQQPVAGWLDIPVRFSLSADQTTGVAGR